MAYYQNAVYRAKGGNELVVESSGTITIKSGGTLTLDSGSTVTFSGNVSLAGTIASSGSVTFSGTVTHDSSALTISTPQTLGTADVATALNPCGISVLTGTTTGPTYTLTTPPVAGYTKDIVMVATSSGATNRAVVYSGSTGVAFGNCIGDVGNTATLATSTCHGLHLVASSSVAWRITGFWPVAPAFSNKST